MGVAKVHVRCGVTVRANVGMLGLRMCGGEWGWGLCARSATVPRACTRRGLRMRGGGGGGARMTIGVVWMKRRVELWGEMLILLRERVMLWREGVMLRREDSEGRELCHTGNKVYRRMH